MQHNSEFFFSRIDIPAFKNAIFCYVPEKNCLINGDIFMRKFKNLTSFKVKWFYDKCIFELFVVYF